MYTSSDLAKYAERKPSSAHVVSMWHVPGGCYYIHAKPVTGFFDESEKEIAEEFVARNSQIPEMAHLTSIEMHDKVCASVLLARKTTMESLAYYTRTKNSDLVLVVPDRDKDGQDVTRAFFFHDAELEEAQYHQNNLLCPAGYGIQEPQIMSLAEYDKMIALKN